MESKQVNKQQQKKKWGEFTKEEKETALKGFSDIYEEFGHPSWLRWPRTVDEFFNDFVKETQSESSLLEFRGFPPLEHLDFAQKIKERIEEATKLIEDVNIEFDQCNKDNSSDVEMLEADKAAHVSTLDSKDNEVALHDAKVKFLDTSKNLMSNDEFKNLAKDLKQGSICLIDKQSHNIKNGKVIHNLNCHSQFVGSSDQVVLDKIKEHVKAITESPDAQWKRTDEFELK